MERDMMFNASPEAKHSPPLTPFETVVERDGAFVFMSNRSGHIFSYLLPNDVLHKETLSKYTMDTLSKYFSMGYTSLLVMEHLQTFLPHEYARDLLTDSPGDPCRKSWKDKVCDGNDYFSFRNPLAVAPMPYRRVSYEFVIATSQSQSFAAAVANDYANIYGCATCTARLVENMFWH